MVSLQFSQSLLEKQLSAQKLYGLLASVRTRRVIGAERHKQLKISGAPDDVHPKADIQPDEQQ